MRVPRFGSVFARFSSLLLASLVIQTQLNPASAAQPPVCWSNDTDSKLPVMNEVVLEWTHEGFSERPRRALINGRVTRHVRSRKTHEHFEVSLGDGPSDTLEVVYSKKFGRIHSIQPGMVFEACGDFLNVHRTRRPGGGQPELGIIHWVHYNPGDRDGGKHEHGYLFLDGVLYGQEKPPRDSFFTFDWMWEPGFAGAFSQP